MDSLDRITLKSFLAALLRLGSSLPETFQKQLNDVSTNFLADITTLDTLTEDYEPLEEEYMEARGILQNDGERFRSSTVETAPFAETNDDKLLNLASEVLKAEDSVDFIKRAYAASPELQLLFTELGYSQLENAKESYSAFEVSDLEVRGSQTYRYKIVELVGKTCIASSKGQKVYDLIHPHLVAGDSVELDFSKVETCVSSFLSFAIGQLLADISQEKIDSLLTVSNLNTNGMRSLKRVFRNFNRYYSIPDIHSKVDKINGELALT